MPITGDLLNTGDVLNTGSRRGGGDPDGLLYGLGDLLDEPLCGLGLGCVDCEGPLSGLEPSLGSTINGLGLGVDCPGSQCGAPGCGDDNGRHGDDNGNCGRHGDDNGDCGRHGDDNGGCKGQGHEHPRIDSGHDCHTCNDGGINVDIGGDECDN